MQKEYYKSILFIYDSLKTLAIIVLATIISFPLIKLNCRESSLQILYIIVIIIVARITTGYFLTIITSIIAGIGMQLFSSYSPTDYFFRWIGLIIIGLLVGSMSAKIKKHTLLLSEREEKSRKLNEINSKLLAANGLEQIVHLALEYLEDFSGHTFIFYTHDPQLEESGILRNCNAEQEKVITSFHEKFVAHWVFQNKKPAGVGTDFNGKSSCIYLPLISRNNVWGVLGIYCMDQKLPEEHDITFFKLIISQVAMALERQHLSDNQQFMTLETEKEKMRSNLLRAVSHDLRTPLTGMIGASATLIESKSCLTEAQQSQLIQHIHEDSNWLLHMVENLLSVTRINEGDAKVDKIEEPLEEVVAESVMRLKKRYPNVAITVEVPLDFIMVPMDATLIEQVILNLVENSIKYSKSKKPLKLLVTKEEEYVLFHIIDYGIGLMDDNMETLFDGYSLNQNNSSDSTKGMGIGLSICKAIINAHGGTIEAKNHESGGAAFTFSLPLERGTDDET